MLQKLEKGRIALDCAWAEYVRFGVGECCLVILPGLGDGLRTVGASSSALARQYKELLPYYNIYVFSRRQPMPTGFTAEDMAADAAEMMDKLGIERADVLGISQGGTVAQYLAADCPGRVRRLAMAVTFAESSGGTKELIRWWQSLARDGDYPKLFKDIWENSYSEEFLRRYRDYYPLLSKISKPDNFTRFCNMAEACLHHDARARLADISCPCLVIGASEDKIVPLASVRALYEALPNARLYIYEGLGHGCNEEAGDFNKRLLDFFQSDL